MSSGVQVNAACLETYQALKLGKKHRYIIFTISSDLKEIIVEKAGEPDSDKSKSATDKYEEFITYLPEDQCKWAVYDFEFEKEDGGRRNKIVFYSWAPDNAKIKDKMLFASSKNALRLSLVGLAVEIQGTDHSEVAYESVLDKVSRGN